MFQLYKYHRLPGPRLSNIVVGVGYTGVEIQAFAFPPFLGLAYTLPIALKDIDRTKLDEFGKLTDIKISTLLKWSYEPLSIRKIVGVATLNAVSQHLLKVKHPYPKLKVDLIDYLKIEKDTRVVFIGLIKPMIRRIGEITKSITIVEDEIDVSPPFNQFQVRKNLGELTESDINADILICTGSALLNDTIEQILSLFKKQAREIVVIGPTASIIPDILFDYGATVVGGTKIIDSEATLKALREGGGPKNFKQFGKKYNLIKKDAY